MQKIVEGVHHFQDEVFPTMRELFEQLAGGQSPRALFITCSDSRIVPSLLTQTGPGELFVVRNAGNIVPTYVPASGGEAGTIEYAVSALGVRHIVVCGHSQCGAMSAVLHPEKVAELPAVRNWLSHAEATARIVKDNYGHLTDPEARLTAAVQENVLVQLENLQTHPSVLSATSRGELHLHGWVYQFETGRVFSFDPATRQFGPLAREVQGKNESLLRRPVV